MKTLPTCLCLLAAITQSSVESGELPGHQPVQLRPEAAIGWKADAASLPKHLIVYRTAPKEIEASTLVALMALGPFTEAHRTDRIGSEPLNDPSMRAYRLVETKKVLGIFPPQGRTIYEDSLSSIPAGSNSGSVPDENESMRIALGWISKLGISTNDLAHVAGSGRLRVYHSPSTVSRFDSASKSLVKEVRHRSLGFVRRVNGVDFTGIGASGGVWIEVGRGGTISNMDVIWPALEPQTTNAVADSATIMAYLRQGKARFPDLQDPKLASQLASASNITILDVVPYYHGGDGEEPEQTVSPFASIRISFAAGGETKELALMCPILKEE